MFCFLRENPNTPAKAGATKNNAAGSGVADGVGPGGGGGFGEAGFKCTPSSNRKGGSDAGPPWARKLNSSVADVAVKVIVSCFQPEKP